MAGHSVSSPEISLNLPIWCQKQLVSQFKKMFTSADRMTGLKIVSVFKCISLTCEKIIDFSMHKWDTYFIIGFNKLFHLLARCTTTSSLPTYLAKSHPFSQYVLQMRRRSCHFYRVFLCAYRLNSTLW